MGTERRARDSLVTRSAGVIEQGERVRLIAQLAEGGARIGAGHPREEPIAAKPHARICECESRMLSELTATAGPIPKREVWESFKRVKANRGAAGVDRQSIADFR
jgi:hypothetical protein